jgi:hypothetical protein
MPRFGISFSLARQCTPVVWLSKTAARLRGGRGNRIALQGWPREHMAIRRDHLRDREVFHRPRLPRSARVWVSNSSPADESRRDGIQTRTPCFPIGASARKGNRRQGEASGVFLSKLPVDKVNRIRIANILAGDLSLDRGRADDTVSAVTMLKHSSLCCDRISC